VQPTGPGATAAWSVPAKIPAIEAAGAALFLLALTVTNDPLERTLAAVAAVLLGLFAVRDRIARVRLAADGDGLTVVSGYAGSRRLPWGAVERIRVTERQRLGMRSRLLEVDAGESLHLFSTRDLGTDPEHVAAVLAELRP
jgi:hypothetical protein